MVDRLPVDTLPLSEGAFRFDFLRGVRVLDLTTSIAGPYATMMLGDMGADVVKVERPGIGDEARQWGPPFHLRQSLWFVSVNRNKRSITLDFSGEEGRRLLYDLIRESDVLVTNYVPRVQEKLGVDAASLAAVKSDLIVVSVTGFGLDGRRADWPCYDLIAEGYSGVMDLTGEAEGAPQKIGTPAADMLAGMDAAYATVVALIDRAATGRGHTIDISLVESMTRFLTPRIVSYLASGEVPRRSGAKDSVIAVYQAFDTADEPMTLGLGNDNIWKRFWAAVGRPEYAEAQDLDTNAKRRNRRQEIVRDIQEILKTKPRRHWLKTFTEARIPAGPINRVDEVVGDEELVARGVFYAMRCAEGRLPQVGTGLRIDGRPAADGMPPPTLGGHTEEILKERLGMDEATIADLRSRRII